MSSSPHGGPPNGGSVDGPEQGGQPRERSLFALFSDLWRETSTLVHEEAALAKAEMSEKVSQMTTGLAELAIGGLIVFAGFIVTLIALSNGLAHFLPNTKLQEVTDKLKELETEFWQAKAKFLEQYGSLRESAPPWALPLAMSSPARNDRPART